MKCPVSHLLLDNRVKDLRLPRQKIQACLNAILNKKHANKRLDVIFVDSKTMKQLNRDFHQNDCVTDVLAFPYEGNYLGEIFVCPDVARRQAKARGLTFTSELVLYVVHGTLHLLGYDDHDPKEALKMRRREEKALAVAGLSTDRVENFHG